MEITNTFNTAAAGPPTDPTTADGPSPQDHGDGGPEEVAAERAEVRADAERGRSAHETAFAEASSPTETSQAVADDPPKPSMSPADAEAELEQLEAGRPAPKLRDDFQPNRKLVQIVHTEVERKRENRISALKAYLDDYRPDPTNSPENAPDGAPEPAF